MMRSGCAHRAGAGFTLVEMLVVVLIIGVISAGVLLSVSLTGRVSPSGGVTVRVSSGPQYAIGTGRLTRTTGSGSWRGQGPSGACAGEWSATRG